MARSQNNNHLSAISEKTQEEKEIEFDVSFAVPTPAHVVDSSSKRSSNQATQRSTAKPRESRFLSHLGSPIFREPGWQQISAEPTDSRIDDAEDEINFRTLEWWQAGMIMIAETISLGILALPSVLATLGMVPGTVLIFGLGVLSTYTGYIIGQFRLVYPWVHSFGDAGAILFEPLHMGAFGREMLGGAQATFQIFTMGSHILTWTICLNTITDSATCTLIWSVVGLVVFWALDLPRTLKNVSYLSIASFLSIFSAVTITMVDVGIERPIGDASIAATRTLSFTTAFLSVSNITFAFAGHCCFFSFIDEFKDPTEWPKALLLVQICETTLYLIAASVIYCFAGPHVASPALDSASPTFKKIAWGVAIPTIIIAGVIYGHVAAKYVSMRIFGQSEHINKRTKTATFSWIGVTGAVWIIAWIIAESIPDFDNLLALISSLFASWFTYGLPGVMWLFLNHGQWFRDWQNTLLFCLNWLLFVMGGAICVLGLWSSGVAIAHDEGGGSWTCRSNAH
ncbi:MAG: hypothetical protein M1822_002020 [Bathelium mastoideum]|nr:MAG: hypothetical protein M1822_002020 [Bathelium mastoideum]